MKPITILLFMCLFTTGFSQEALLKTQHYDRNFILLDSNYILIPITWANTGKFNNVKIESSYPFTVKNIIFYNIKNDSCKYLFKDSLQLIQYIREINYNNSSMEFSLDIVKDSIHAQLKPDQNDNKVIYTFNDYLLYEVINEDYNQDGKLSTDDPIYLYASKYDGTGLVQITPRFYTNKNYKYFKKEKMILAVLLNDSNGDKKFDNEDKEVLYKIDLTNFSNSKILIDLQIKSK